MYPPPSRDFSIAFSVVCVYLSYAYMFLYGNHTDLLKRILVLLSILTLELFLLWSVTPNSESLHYFFDTASRVFECVFFYFLITRTSMIMTDETHILFTSAAYSIVSFSCVLVPELVVYILTCNLFMMEFAVVVMTALKLKHVSAIWMYFFVLCNVMILTTFDFTRGIPHLPYVWWCILFVARNIYFIFKP